MNRQKIIRNGTLVTASEIFSADILIQEDKYVMAPPLRVAPDNAAMWRGLQDNALAFVVTDHCPFTRAQRSGKRRTPEFRKLPDGKIEMPAEEAWSNEVPPFYKLPGGGPGIETRMLLTYQFGVNEKRLALNPFVAHTSTNAAKLYKLYPRKGTLAPGADADVALWNPQREVTLTADALHQNVDYTPYEGWRVRGAPQTVLARGAVVVRDGKFAGTQGRGAYLPRVW
jgi:dihydropyrimidinase